MTSWILIAVLMCICHGLDLKAEHVSSSPPPPPSSSSSAATCCWTWASTLSLSSTEVDSSCEISNQDKLKRSKKPSLLVLDSGSSNTLTKDYRDDVNVSSESELKVAGVILEEELKSVDVGEGAVIDANANEVQPDTKREDAVGEKPGHPADNSHHREALNVDSGPMGVLTPNALPPAYLIEDQAFTKLVSMGPMEPTALKDGCKSEDGDCKQIASPPRLEEKPVTENQQTEERKVEEVGERIVVQVSEEPEQRNESFQPDPVIDNRSAFDGILDEAFSAEDLWSIENILLKPSAGAEKVSTPLAEGQSTEDMPSFNEWAKKRLEEREKTGKSGVSQSSSGQQGKPAAAHKIRHKNYASGDCGAKIVNANSEAQGAHSILNSYKDEYMLNPCTAKIWFVVELCEPIQADRLEMANFELFSSAPKEFSVSASDRFPTREWKSVGNFVAQEGRSMQSFALQHETFGKFIKVEMASHYGSEHFCPLSLVRVFGTSEYEALEGEDHDSSSHSSSTDEDETREERDLGALAGEEAQNLFGSAKEAVMSIVKKAAQALSRDKSTADSPPKGGESEGVAEPSTAQQDCVSLQRLPNLDCQDVGNATRYELLRSQMLTTLRCEFNSLQRSLRRFGGPRFWDRCPACRAYVTSEAFLKEQVCFAWKGFCGYIHAVLGPIRFGSLCHLSKLMNDDKKRVPLEIRTCESLLLDTGATTVTTKCDPTVEYATRTLTTATVSPHSVGVQQPTSTETLGMKLESEIDNVVSPVVIETPLVTEVTKSPKIQPTKTLPSYTVLGDDVTARVSPFCVDELSQSFSPVKSQVFGTQSVAPPEAPDEKRDTESKLELEPLSVPEVSASMESDDVVKDPVDKISPAVPVMVTLSPDTVSKVAKVLENTGETLVVVPAEQVEAGNVQAADRFGPMGASQKESVFVRLTNRIKALELNMSLSGQYLEELSRRYRRQMEEMQRAFNKTVGALNETARKAYERDMKQQEMIGILQSRVENLTNAVGNLLAQQDSLHTQVIGRHLFLMMMEVLVMLAVIYLCMRPAADTQYNKSFAVTENVGAQREPAVTPTKEVKGGGKRRNSVVGTIGYVTPSAMNHRRPSEEALDITANHSHLVIVEPSVPILVDSSPVRVDLEMKKRRKSKSKKCAKNLYRSVSNTILASSARPPPHPAVQRKGSGNNHTSAGVLFGTTNSSQCGTVDNAKSRRELGNSCHQLPRTSSPVSREPCSRKTLKNYVDEGAEPRQGANGFVQNRVRSGQGISRPCLLIDPKSMGLDQCQDTRQAKGPFNVKKVLQKVYA